MTDRRQFLITNRPTAYDGFRSLAMNGAWLVHHEDLRITPLTDADGCPWLLLGDAYCVDQPGRTPAEALSRTQTSDIGDAYYYWTGRWLLIGSGQIHSDASGLIALHYIVDGERWAVSPSLHVLAGLFSLQNTEDTPAEQQHFATHCIPAPMTCFKQVRRAYPSQYIRFDGERITLQGRQRLTDQRALTNGERIKALAAYLRTAAANAARFSQKQVKLALTGGNDSRVILAALLAQGIPFESFTMQHGDITKGDRCIPREMASRFGFRHRYIKRNRRPSAEREAVFDRHTFFSHSGADRGFYAGMQTDGIGAEALVLKGGLLDLCRGSQYPAFGSEMDMMAYFLSLSPKNERYQKYNGALQEWFDWRRRNPDFLDIRDAFSLDQHIGGWLANLQQSADLLDGVYLQLANSAAILSLICSFSAQERSGRQVYRQLYDSLYPAVAQFPVNPPDILKTLRHYGKSALASPIIAFKKAVAKLRKRV